MQMTSCISTKVPSPWYLHMGIMYITYINIFMYMCIYIYIYIYISKYSLYIYIYIYMCLFVWTRTRHEFQGWKNGWTKDCWLVPFGLSRVVAYSSNGSLVVAISLTMWFLPSALNVKLMKFKQARVNGGSNYVSLKEAKCLII